MGKIPKKTVFELLTDPNVFLQIAGRQQARIEIETCSVIVTKGKIGMKPYLMVEVRQYSEDSTTIRSDGYTFQVWRVTKRMTEQGVITFATAW